MKSENFKAFPLGMIIRYGYAGLLATTLAAALTPEWVKEMTDALGKIATPLVILAIGGTIYVLYRNVVGEYLFFQLADLLHLLLDKIQQRESRPSAFLGKLGVSLTGRRAAYTDIRRELLPSAQRDYLDYVHTELHILYVTAAECIGAAILIRVYCLPFSTTYLWIIGIAALSAATVADIRQHRGEWRRLNMIDRNELSNFLVSRGYIKSPIST